MTSDTSEMKLVLSLDNVLVDRNMKRQWDIEELIEHFTLVDEDKDVLENKTGATLLDCALLLKYFEYEARFPSAKYEIPKAVVDYVARQLKVDANVFAQYDWDGRTIKLHQTQIREHLKFREATVADSEKMTAWLIATHLSTDQNPDHLKAKVLVGVRLMEADVKEQREFLNQLAEMLRPWWEPLGTIEHLVIALTPGGMDAFTKE